MEEPTTLWTACATLLREQISEAVWLTSFNAVEPVAIEADTLVLSVPSSLVRERIESRYLPMVVGALADVGRPDLGLDLVVREADLPDPDGFDELAADALGGPVDAEGAQAGTTHPETGLEAGEGQSEPRYTFDDFVTGTSNRFAQAAALAVAETPGRNYNPLFIYSEPGLGKTHLLQAIGHYVGEHYPASVVRYLSSEQFLNEYVDALRHGEMPSFKKRYREVDVLLIDDIQFIETREGLREEFFHTFNAVYQANGQIVLSSDRPPDAMHTLEDRLRSRFRMGLITEINPPDLETRLAILRKKAEQDPTEIPNDVLELIASRITNNIRELEGALIRVSAYASLTGETVNMEMAERVLHDLLGDNEPRAITPELILEKTSEMFGFPIEELQGKSRRRPLVTARQIGMYVFRELTDLSYPAIAREFGGRDHTTVIHAVDKIGTLMKEKRQIYDQVTELTQSIRAGS